MHMLVAYKKGGEGVVVFFFMGKDVDCFLVII